MNSYLKLRAIGDPLLRVAATLVLLTSITTFAVEKQNAVLLDALPQVRGAIEATTNGRNLHLIPNPSAILSQIMEKEDVNVTLMLGGQQQYDMLLQRINLFQSNFVYREINEDEDKSLNDLDIVTYRGVLRNKEDSRVRLTLSDNYISGMIDDGTGHPQFIESIGLQESGDLLIAHHDQTDTQYNPVSLHQDYANSPYGDSPPMADSPVHLRHDNAVYTAEIALVADFEAFEKAGSSIRLATELISILNMTDGYYQDLGIAYKLVELIIFTDPSAGNWPDTDNAGTYLKAFDLWVAGGGVANWHDIATFWTGKAFGYSYAWLGTIGQYGRHHVVEFWGMGESRWLANFQAHEAGHNWGASHVAHDPRYIMSPYIYDGPLLWNDTTQQNFQFFKQNAITHLTPGVDSGAPVVSFSQPLILSGGVVSAGVEPGEEVTLRVTVTNIGNNIAPQSQLEIVVLDTTDEWLVSFSGPQIIPALGIEDSITIEHQLQVNAAAPTPAWLKLGYKMTANGLAAKHPFDLGMGLRAIYELSLGVLEISGNSDGKFHPGEKVALTLDVENIGEIKGETLAVEVELDSLSKSFVHDIQYPSIVQSIGDHEKTQIVVSMDLDTEFPSGHRMDVTIRLSEDQAEIVYARSFVVGLPAGYAYWEDFEYDRIGSTYSGWNVQSPIPTQEVTSENVLTVQDQVWGTWDSAPFEGERSLFLASHWIGSMRIVSPLISLGGLRRPRLDFQEMRSWDHTQSEGIFQHNAQLQYATNPEGPWYTLETISADVSDIGVWKGVADLDLEEIVNQDVYLALYSNQAHLFWRLDKIGVRDDAASDPIIPDEQQLFNYPNPFNASTTILYDLDERSDVSIELFNLRGQLVALLAGGSKPAGTHQIDFRAEELAAGMYLCRLQTDDDYHVAKMLLMK